jgi:hypothetical protein
VKATCIRSERRCREELTRTEKGQVPVAEVLECRIKEWTRAKLVAARQVGASEVQLLVSLTGDAPEKVMTGRRQEGRPRSAGASSRGRG